MTGKEVRRLLLRLLYAPAPGGLRLTRNAHIQLHYATAMEILASEPSNHAYMLDSQLLKDKSFVEQIILLCREARTDARASALRSLRLLATGGLDDVCDALMGLQLMPALLEAACSTHEEVQIDVREPDYI